MSAPPPGPSSHRPAGVARSREHCGSQGAAAGPAVALLLGCLAGLALAWHAILSDAARDRVYLSFTGIGYTATASAGQGPAAVVADDATVDGMPRSARRLSKKPLAMWRRSAAASDREMATRSPLPLPARPLESADQLVLADETGPAVGRPADDLAGAPAAVMQITFDVNSSFLQAGSVAVLRDLLDRLPKGRPARLAVSATVSDDGVRTADPHEAYRYNRWLAERRIERVSGWLSRHAPSGVAIAAGFLEHDASRLSLIHI